MVIEGVSSKLIQSESTIPGSLTLREADPQHSS